MGGWACQKDRRWLFWLVEARRGERRDLRADIEGRKVDALVLWFVVMRDTTVRRANGQGGDGAVGVEGVSVGVGSVAVEGAVRVDGADDVEAAAAAAVVEGGDDGVDDVGGVV